VNGFDDVGEEPPLSLDPEVVEDDVEFAEVLDA
jgi:hypothetical protein